MTYGLRLVLPALAVIVVPSSASSGKQFNLLTPMLVEEVMLLVLFVCVCV